MLERARAISFALLGLTAAIGLAIVALALNQGWPLIAGSSIPRIPSQHQAIGKATVAAGVMAGDTRSEHTGATGRPRSYDRDGSAKHPPGGTSPGASPAPTGSAEFVVSPSAPAKPRGGHAHNSPQPAPAPTTQPAPHAPEAPTAPAPTEPIPSPAPLPSAAEPMPPDATTSEAPAEDAESDVPSWSHGGGHGYGHDDDDWDDHGDDWDDGDSHDGDGYGHDGRHGHHYDDYDD